MITQSRGKVCRGVTGLMRARFILFLAQKKLVVQGNVRLSDQRWKGIGEFEHRGGQGELRGSWGTLWGAVYTSFNGLGG